MLDKENNVLHFFLEQNKQMNHYYINIAILKQDNDQQYGIEEIDSSISDSDDSSINTDD